MDIYTDIKKGLEDLGFYVLVAKQKRIKDNPYIILNKSRNDLKIKKFELFLMQYWNDYFSSLDKNELFFDYIIVIDGLTFHPCILDILKRHNPQIMAINYLYDRVKGVYQIDFNFKFFDRIYSFDRNDVKEYGLILLPIYWIPTKEILVQRDIFAFGSYDILRKNAFIRIKHIADKAHISYFVKMYYPEIKNKLLYNIKGLVRKFLMRKSFVSLKELDTDLFTSVTMTPNEFRDKIGSSRVVLDTNHPYQDGLTARFMWALGEGKKIITNNYHVSSYDFYTNDQILILNAEVTDGEILDFITSDYEMPKRTRELIDHYRIDNWLKTLLSI